MLPGLRGHRDGAGPRRPWQHQSQARPAGSGRCLFGGVADVLEAWREQRDELPSSPRTRLVRWGRDPAATGHSPTPAVNSQPRSDQDRATDHPRQWRHPAAGRPAPAHARVREVLHGCAGMTQTRPARPPSAEASALSSDRHCPATTPRWPHRLVSRQGALRAFLLSPTSKRARARSPRLLCSRGGLRCRCSFATRAAVRSRCSSGTKQPPETSTTGSMRSSRWTPLLLAWHSSTPAPTAPIAKAVVTAGGVAGPSVLSVSRGSAHSVDCTRCPRMPMQTSRAAERGGLLVQRQSAVHRHQEPATPIRALRSRC